MTNLGIVLFFFSVIIHNISYGDSFSNVLESFDITNSSHAVEFLFDKSQSHYTVFLSSALKVKNGNYITDIFSQNRNHSSYDLYDRNMITHFIVSGDAIKRSLLVSEIDVFLSYMSSKIPSGSMLYVYFVSCTTDMTGKDSYQDLLFQNKCFHKRFLTGLFMQFMYHDKSISFISNDDQDRMVLKLVKD